ncbi:hypothetical protein ACEWY4_019828 [Coilia grayii]|uniref:CARD domain-containing protein n=1 Tax=Coilia grayii TaxID=363190 RepID=A0ABD1JCJ2_9TELE
MELPISRSGVVISPEKRLRGHLLTLSKSLPLCLVEKMTANLFHTRTITGHEVEIIVSQPTESQKASHLIQIVLRKGRKACELFYQCLGECCPALYGKLTGTPATTSNAVYDSSVPLNTINKQPAKHTSVAMSGVYPDMPTSHCCSSPERKFTPYAPAYVINIHNSVLCHCVIGNHSSQTISTERDQLLHQRQHFSLQDTRRTSLIYDQQGAAEISGEPHIQVQDSHMEYVIIGDQSSMVVNSVESEEDEEGEDNEEYQHSSDTST